MSKLKVLDLFSGIGGFSLGLERTGGFETVAFCEIEPFPRRVLAKHWPEVFIHDDVRTLNKETLCNGYAENALLNRLCREMGGNLASVKSAIETIKESAGKKALTSTMNGPQSAEKALSIIMAGSVPAAESESTLFWQSITSIITEAKSAQHTKELHGKSLSSADFLTIIRFFATTATRQNPSTVPAHIKTMAGVSNDDVRTLTADTLRRDGIAVDVITGGFPCQDISTSGKLAGIADGTRSGLWSEIVRLATELRPQFVIVENVSNLLAGPSDRAGGWFGRVLGDLAEIGLDAEWHCIPASFVGAWHERDRVWLLAYRSEELRERITSGPLFRQPHLSLQLRRGFAKWPGRSALPSTRFCRAGDGVPDRLDRLAALGNAVVPQIPELIGHAILASRRAAA